MVFVQNLKLKVNREKIVVAYIGKVKFLGYEFYSAKRGIKLRVHNKSIAKMKAKIKGVTSRRNALGYEGLSYPSKITGKV